MLELTVSFAATWDRDSFKGYYRRRGRYSPEDELRKVVGQRQVTNDLCVPIHVCQSLDFLAGFSKLLIFFLACNENLKLRLYAPFWNPGKTPRKCFYKHKCLWRPSRKSSTAQLYKLVYIPRLMRGARVRTRSKTWWYDGLVVGLHDCNEEAGVEACPSNDPANACTETFNS